MTASLGGFGYRQQLSTQHRISTSFLADPVKVAISKCVASGRFVAPNGSLMRTHPIGVIGVAMSEEEAWRLATELGRCTHIDLRCILSCCIEVAIIRGLLRGEVLDEGVDAVIQRSYKWVKQ
jgi:ADP-ribosylglycohydrolase